MDGQAHGQKGHFLSISICLIVSTQFLAGCLGKEELAAQRRDAIEPAQNYIVKVKSTFSGGLRSFGDTGKSPVQDSMASYRQASADDGTQVQNISGQFYRISFGDQANRRAELQTLESYSDVEYIEPDYEVHAFLQPNDPQLIQQWAHTVVKSYQAWDFSVGSENVTVAIIDTGVDPNHEDLIQNLWTNEGEIPNNGIDDDGNGYVDDIHGYDFVNNDGDPTADDAPTYHGTHVAGTIGAEGNNGIGVTGHAHRVKMMSLKFLGHNGSGNISDAIRAIDYAIANGAKIMNNSWGGPGQSQALSDAITRAKNAGILFVAAAGNGGQDGLGDNNDSVPTFPASYGHSNIISVAATTQNDTMTTFSNYGLSSVDLGAPGQGIYSTQNGGGYQNLSGTSMATPLVAGVAATMLALNPNLTPDEIKSILMSTVDQMTALNGKVASGGRINAYKALKAVNDGETPEPQPNPNPGPSPNPNPGPNPTPGPNPAPVPGEIAAAPTFNGGFPALVVNNPNQVITINYDLSGFSNVAGAYIEMSRPNSGFQSPNSAKPDPFRLLYWLNAGAVGSVGLYPPQHLPGWGSYKVRVIPLNQLRQPVGKFSNAATLVLSP